MKVGTQLYDFLLQIPLSIWVLMGLGMCLRIVSRIGGAKIKGWIGEKVTSRIVLMRLPSTVYSIYSDLYLPRPDGQGSTQIDHVIVSQYGIFVGEAKNYNGWIFGSEKSRQWTVSLGRRKFKFQNPLHQNELHIRALSDYLEIEKHLFTSIVFFVGESAFKTSLPANVLDKGFLSYLRSFQTERLNMEAVQRINKTLTNLDRLLDRRSSAKAHSKAIKNRMSKQASGWG